MDNNNFSKNILEKINTLENKIDNLENKINLIIELLNNNDNITNEIKQKCDKMGEHIDFVDKVYDNVKKPLGMICNKLSYFSYNKTNQLEDIKK